jgi:mannonate dehydratase
MEGAMYVGTQIEPRDDSDYRVWAQLGVTHVCVDPPGSPHYWSLDALRQHKAYVECFGLSLDMVQLPIASGPIEAGDRPHILLARGPEWQREIDGLCGLIERLAAAGISAAKYNLSVLGVSRTDPEAGRGGSRNKAFRWSRADPQAPPTLAGIVSEDENWERIDRFLAAIVPVATAAKVRLACHPHDPFTPPGWRGVTRVLGTVEGLKRFVLMHESPITASISARARWQRCSPIRAGRSLMLSAGSVNAANCSTCIFATSGDAGSTSSKRFRRRVT